MTGFDIGNTINAAAEWVSTAPIIRTVVNNPIFTALLLTAIIVVIVLGMYYSKGCPKDSKRLLTMTLYIFFTALVIVFIHHAAITKQIHDSVENQGVRDVFAGIEASRAAGAYGHVPVVPKIGGDNESYVAVPVAAVQKTQPIMPAVPVARPRPANVTQFSPTDLIKDLDL